MILCLYSLLVTNIFLIVFLILLLVTNIFLMSLRLFSLLVTNMFLMVLHFYSLLFLIVLQFSSLLVTHIFLRVLHYIPYYLQIFNSYNMFRVVLLLTYGKLLLKQSEKALSHPQLNSVREEHLHTPITSCKLFLIILQ